jgi:hypothetical protein
MAIINPDHSWDSCEGKPLSETVRASFRNIEQLFDLLNQKKPPVMPNILEGTATDEFAFLMSEI